MVNQVLVAERDADDALHHQGLDIVLDKGRIAMILKAGGQPPGQADHPVGGAQQQRASFGGDPPAVERSHHRTAFHAWKFKQRRVTLCRHRGTPLLSDKALSQKNFRSIRAPMHMTPVRDPGAPSGQKRLSCGSSVILSESSPHWPGSTFRTFAERRRIRPNPQRSAWRRGRTCPDRVGRIARWPWAWRCRPSSPRSRRQLSKAACTLLSGWVRRPIAAPSVRRGRSSSGSNCTGPGSSCSNLGGSPRLRRSHVRSRPPRLWVARSGARRRAPPWRPRQVASAPRRARRSPGGTGSPVAELARGVERIDIAPEHLEEFLVTQLAGSYTSVPLRCARSHRPRPARSSGRRWSPPV